MTYQSSMTRRTLALVAAALLVSALGAFSFAQSAFADFVSGSSSLDALSAQDESSTSGTTDGSTDESAANTVEESTEIYRMYNPNSGEHFYTGEFNEAMHLVSVGWNYESVAWVSEAKANGVAVYRLYNPNAGDHHYTIEEKEKDHLVEVGWNYEGIAFYSAQSDATAAKAVHRQYNPNATTGAHNFTLSVDERDDLVDKGWRDEKVAWYAFAYDEDSESPKASATVFRMHNPNSGEHFYTSSKKEVGSLVKSGWEFEKATWVSLAEDEPNAKAVYRLYNKNASDHHYTMAQDERDDLVKQGWNNEGVAFYCADPSATDSALIDIYRVYNPNQVGAGSHFFTPSSTERDALVELGWHDEKVAWKAKSA